MEPEKCRVLTIDPKIYSQQEVIGATYKFLEQAYFHLEHSDDGKSLIMEIRLKENQDGDVDLDSLSGEIENEMMDQALRNIILKGTRKVRDLIITGALSSSPPPEAHEGTEDLEKDEESLREIRDLLKEIDEEDEKVDDPSMIAVEWEEKYGEDTGKGD